MPSMGFDNIMRDHQLLRQSLDRCFTEINRMYTVAYTGFWSPVVHGRYMGCFNNAPQPPKTKGPIRSFSSEALGKRGKLCGKRGKCRKCFLSFLHFTCFPLRFPRFLHFLHFLHNGRTDDHGWGNLLANSSYNSELQHIFTYSNRLEKTDLIISKKAICFCYIWVPCWPVLPLWGQ